MAAGQPKPTFYVALALVVLGLIAFAVYRSDIVAPKPVQPQGGAGGQPQGKLEPKDLGPEQHAESTDSTSPTTVKEYNFKPAEKLPPVKGVAAYKPLKDNTVRFALNVWAGWAPIVLANNGFKAGQEWKTADGKPFKVDLVLIDNPVQMRDAYAAGEVHIGWATLDMVPLFLESFVDPQGNPRDSRIMPRVYQQVDFSNGGDGVVVRENIKTVADLRGKKLVLAQNSPSHYFALNMLVSGGVQLSEVNMVFTEDAFQAAAAFNAQKDIAGCVSWAPDIYNLAKAKGNRLLVTTKEANHLIADVWFARADFARDNTPIIEAISRGIFDAMERLKQEPAAEGLRAHGLRLQHPRLRRVGDAGRCAQHQLGREFPVLYQPEQPDQFRAHLAAVVSALPPHRRDRPPAGAVRSGHGFLDHPEAGPGRQVRLAEGRVRHPARSQGTANGAGRGRGDLDQHGGDALLPQ